MRVRPDRSGRLSFLLLVALSLLVAGPGCTSSGSGGAAPLNDIPDPVFTDPVEKIAQTGDVDAFSRTLYDQARAVARLRRPPLSGPPAARARAYA